MANDIAVKAVSGNSYKEGTVVTGTNKFGTSDTLDNNLSTAQTRDTDLNTKYSARMNMNPEVVQEASPAAENTFTSNAKFAQGIFNVSVSGTWVGTVSLQRSFDAGSTWHDVNTYTANDEQVVENAEDDVLWRLGIATGNYTSGTAVCRISQ
jgi:hypothetical protein